MKALLETRRVLTTFLVFTFILLSPAVLFSQDCEIYKFKAKHTHCVDDTFIARIWFKYENTSDQFQLWVNGADSGLYYYEDLPLWIGPLPADGMTPHAFMVEDVGIAGCGYLYTMDPVECDEDDECAFEDVEVEEKDCEDGEFYAKVDFENEGGGDQFQLWVNDVDFGYYYYEDVPLYLGPFPADGMTVHVFAAEDAETAGCGFVYTMDPVECDEGGNGGGNGNGNGNGHWDCTLYDFSAKVRECDEGEFMAKVNMKHRSTSDEFQLWVNGEDYGMYAYHDLPIYVGPLPADGMTPHVFMAEDAETEGCECLYTMDPVVCHTGNGNGPPEMIVNLYPVPARDKLEITFSTEVRDMKKTIEIMDMNGLLYHYSVTNGEENTMININGLQPGIYFIRVIESSSAVEVRKFLIK